MKKTLSIVFSFFLLGSAAGQNLNIDSLLKVAMSSKARAAVIINPNRDSMIRLIPLTEAPSDRITLIYNIIERSGSLNPKDAFYYHKKILEITRKNHDDVGEAIILAELGYLVSVNGDNPEGLKIILSALKLAEKSGNARAMGIVYDNLGVCTENNSAVRKSYYQKALHFSQAGGDDEFVCFELHNLSGVYKQENRKDSMEYYFKKGFVLSVKKNLQVNLPANLLIFAQNQTTASNQLKYLKLALQMPYTRLDAETGTGILYSIARVYKQEGKTDSAIFYARTAYQTSLNGSFVGRITPTKFLAGIYLDQHNADSALKYTIIYHSQRDSISSDNKLLRAQAMGFSEQRKIQEAEAQRKEFQNRIWSYFLASVILFLLILAFIFWRNNRQKQKANYLLNEQKEEIETQRDSLGQALEHLKNTQTQLLQREKMASLGELTAGIAHEIQNPLNFVNNFSEVNREMIAELKAELDAENMEEAIVIADDIAANEEKINHHGKRAEAIVKGMLQHSRSSASEEQLTNLNAIADEFLKLSYHGLRTKDQTFNAELVTNFDDSLPKVNVIAQDIGRVMLNLFNNAFYAVNQKAKIAGPDYKPEVSVETFFFPLQGVGGFTVHDNGVGIPDAIKDKIMQPFFTTKPTGEGTGLGLSLTYDMVVKGHGGSIQVNSVEGDGSAFIIQLPIS